MAIILRLICENLSSIAVKISFLWGCEHCVYAEASFAASVSSWYLRSDMQNFTSVKNKKKHLRKLEIWKAVNINIGQSQTTREHDADIKR